MDITQEALQKMVADAVLAAMPKPPETIPAQSAAPLEGATPAFVNLDELRSKLIAEMQGQMQRELEGVKTAASRMFNATLAEMHETQRVADFALAVTSGRDTNLALPMAAERIEKFLLTLNTNQRAEAEAILGEVVKTGLVDFNAKGRPGSTTPLLDLPAELVKRLDAKEIEVADLGNKYIQPLLEGHKPEEYDLSKWAKVNGG